MKHFYRIWWHQAALTALMHSSSVYSIALRCPMLIGTEDATREARAFNHLHS